MKGMLTLTLLPLIFSIAGCQSGQRNVTKVSPPSKLHAAQVATYLSDHPQFTQEFYKNWQKKQQQTQHKQRQNHYNQIVQQLFDSQLFFSLGTSSADITLASFLDYSSTQSKSALKLIDQLLKQEKNLKVIIIPLATSPLAQTLTRLAFNAQSQEKLDQFHQEIIAITGLITNKDQKDIAKKLALNSRPLPDHYQKNTIFYITGLNLQSLPSYLIGFSQQTALRTPLTITGKTSLYYLQGILQKYRETEKSRLAKILKEKKKTKSKPAIIVTEITSTPSPTTGDSHYQQLN